jgi:hypothetical protein
MKLIERRKIENGIVYRLPSWYDESPMAFHVFHWKDYLGNIRKESMLWLASGITMRISRKELAKTIKEARNATK